MAPLLVDLDLDYFFNDPADWTRAPSKGIWARAQEAIDYLTSLTVQERVLVIDHHEVLNHWDVAGFSESLCYHFDAHHDAFVNNANAWRRPLGSRGAMVGVGDFMFQALREEIIHELVWCTPPLEIPADTADSLRKMLGPQLGARVKTLAWPERDQIDRHIDLLSVSISPEWLHPDSAGWIESTLLRLGFQQAVVDKGLDETKTRWSIVTEFAEHMAPHRYRFPRDYR